MRSGKNEGQELLVRQEDKDYQIAATHRDMYVLYCEKKLTNRNLRVSTSGARMKHNVHGSLLTNAHLCEQTHSATARHEYAAKRNTNSTAAVTSNL